MEKKLRVCKICNRRFANGKAMGGHMRSHLAKLPLPPKPTLASSSSSPPLPPQPSKSSPSLSPSSEVNHMQQPGSINFHEVSNEADSSKINLTRRRSKRQRLRKLPLDMVVGSPSDSVSSVVLSTEETLSCEDAARCLLMLSRDKWTRTSARKLDKPEVYEFVIDGDEDLVGDENMDEDDYENENDDDDELYSITNHGAKAKYKCETCNKVFKSHQALGGHRASHKNKQILRDEEGGEEGEREESNGGFSAGGGNQINHVQRIFKCLFCNKVFRSGQALGGHKKVHFTFLNVPDKASNLYETTSSSSDALQLFDLNQPAPED